MHVVVDSYRGDRSGQHHNLLKMGMLSVQTCRAAAIVVEIPDTSMNNILCHLPQRNNE